LLVSRSLDFVELTEVNAILLPLVEVIELGDIKVAPPSDFDRFREA
jgi:hypothetical protein